ncbi:hypothetical protein, partial [Escherichia coli]|uniref:hypothetical protein n=1 Tax=Escherichia coli TaxID=562 RepID=UPI001BE47729
HPFVSIFIHKKKKFSSPTPRTILVVCFLVRPPQASIDAKNYPHPDPLPGREREKTVLMLMTGYTA